MGMGSRPNTMMPQYGGFPQGGFGQQSGAGTYDPMLGFGQASGMGTTYDYPTRYSADYTRYAQSGQPFNQPVMGYNTYGQIFAQPQRPPPSFGKGGGGFRPQPPPIMGGGKGGYDPNRRMQANPGFDTPFGNFPQPRRPERRSNQLGLNQPPTIGGKGGGGQTDNITIRRPSVGFDPENRFRNVPEPGPQGLPSPLVPIRKPLDQERILPDQNIANSPFGQLIGFGLGRMPQQTVDPYQGSYNISTIPYQGGAGNLTPVQQASGTVDQNAYNPAFRQQQQFLAQQQQISDRAPPGMMRNPNYNAARAMQSDVPMPGSDDYLSRQAFIPVGGGFGNMAFFQEGGQVPPDAASNMDMMLSEAGPANPQSEMAGEYDRLIQMTMQAVLGQTENADEIIQMFIDEFGVDAFRQLRDAVLKQQVPNAQTEGMVDGNGGGMDDQVMGMIGNQRPVAVSPGEYIVPADVVSGLGDGSSKSGADILDELNQAVRMARTGTTEQPRPLAESMR